MADEGRQKESLHQYGRHQNRKDTGGSCHANMGWAARSHAFVHRRPENEWLSRETKLERNKICDVNGGESDLFQFFVFSSQWKLENKTLCMSRPNNTDQNIPSFYWFPFKKAQTLDAFVSVLPPWLSFFSFFFFSFFLFFYFFSVHHTWNPIPNRTGLFHSTAAPDVSYIVFNTVEIFVYKVQCSLIFLWSALSLLFLLLFSSFCSLELGSPFVWICRGLLSRWYLFSLPN